MADKIGDDASLPSKRFKDMNDGTFAERVVASIVDKDGNDATAASGPHFLQACLATDNATLVKGTAGVLNSIYADNTANAKRYLKLYNKATAPSAADTPWMVIVLPAGAYVVLEPAGGFNFPLGIGYRIVTGAANNDNTAPVAGDVQQLVLGTV